MLGEIGAGLRQEAEDEPVSLACFIADAFDEQATDRRTDHIHRRSLLSRLSVTGADRTL